MPSSDRRPWVRLDTSYFRNMKIVRISDAAKVLHLTLITTAAEEELRGLGAVDAEGRITAGDVTLPRFPLIRDWLGL